MVYSKAEQDGFFEAVDSLKKYRRAEIVDDSGKDLVDTLYTDLLPNEQILRACLTSNTTFLIGRKGTGKSTVFLKLQRELRKRGSILSCYIDTKTIFEYSQAELTSVEHLGGLISDEGLRRYNIEKNFIQGILKEIIKEIKERSGGVLEQLKQVFGLSGVQLVKEKLQELIDMIENNEHLKAIEVPSLKQVQVSKKFAAERANETTLTLDDKATGKLTPKDFGIDISSSANEAEKASRKNVTELGEQFSDVFLKVFQIKTFIHKIKEILSLLEIRGLFILLDDFSEIPDHSMRSFVDVILAPLNNWSEDFIKFKVAAYPNRVYYGNIDQGKIDKINLDFYNLYSTKGDRNVMEEKAINFTQRLIEKRIYHFTSRPVEFFFDTRSDSTEDYYELIFQISMNVPRIVGYILYYCYESRIVYGKLINKASLKDAAEKYFDQALEPFFHSTTYSLKSFEEKISILQLRELLQKFVDEMRAVRRRIVTSELAGVIYDESRSNPYTSHFHFNPIHEQFLKTLELNFFISKYSEMSSRDGGKQSVYCLNYGLCVKHNLRWGKPSGNEHRKYFISRPFDFNNIIEVFLKNSKHLICINPSCSRNFPFEQLQFLEFNNMRCPNCQNQVRIISNSEAIQRELEAIDKAKLLPVVELGIIYEIHKSEKSLKPKEIAEELDCSHQLIGQRAKKLDEKNLVVRDGEPGRRFYRLTDKAIDDYFTGTE